MFKPYHLLIILIFISCKVRGQVGVMNGFLLDSITHFPISNGTVENATSKKSVQSNDRGFFHLEAAPNDFIYAYAKAYRYDTLVYSFIFNDTITLYLAPSGNILPNVTVKTKYNKYQLDSIERRTAFEENRGNTMKTLSTSHPSGFGLTFNLDKVFQKKYKNQKKGERMLKNREEMEYVDYRFSPHIVAYYTGLKGDTLKKFIQQYTPGYTWLRLHPTNEDMLYYINDKLKLYKSAEYKQVEANSSTGSKN